MTGPLDTINQLRRMKRMKAQLRAERAAARSSRSSARREDSENLETCEAFFRHRLNLDITDEQWVLVRVLFDRVDPADLDDAGRAAARRMFGNIDRFRSEARHTVAMLKGARVGGTWLWSLYLLWRGLTADLSRLAPGEVGFAPIVCERKDLGLQSINYIRGGLVQANLDHLRTNNAKESVDLLRLGGHRVTIKVFAAARGGAAIRGKSYVGALLDEACFFRAQDSGVVNDKEIYRAIAPRVMAGGTLGLVSTAWAEEGLLWELVKSNLGPPSGDWTAKHETAVACVTPTEVLRHDEKILADIAIARATDPESAAREFDCVPLAQNTSRFFGEPEVSASIALGNGLPDEILPRPYGVAVGIGVDTGLVRDSSSLVAVHAEDGMLTVARAIERKPEQGKPLKLSEVCKAYEAEMLRQGQYQASADAHEFEASLEHFEQCSLVAAPTGIDGKQEAYTLTRTLMREGRLRIPECHTKLIKQLREVVCKPLDGGRLKIWSPRNAGGHGDIVSSLVNAVWELRASAAAPDYDPTFDHDLPNLRI